MKRILLLLGAALTALVIHNSDTKAQPAATAGDSALLYEITGKDLKKPSYLFGTIHIICEKDMFPAAKLDSYFSKTEQLLLEFDMDDPLVMQKGAQLSLLPDGGSVSDLVSGEEYQKIDALFKSFVGLSFDVFKNFKPLTSTALLMTSPKVLNCERTLIYDSFLSEKAVAAKKPVIGLETIEEQIAVMDSIPVQKQVEALKKTAADPQVVVKGFKLLYETYLRQNSDELFNVAVTQLKPEEGYSQEIMLDKRNSNWISTIEKSISAKPSFIAVGGGHLGGEKGVLSLLRAKGYNLKPIKL